MRGLQILATTVAVRQDLFAMAPSLVQAQLPKKSIEPRLGAQLVEAWIAIYQAEVARFHFIRLFEAIYGTTNFLNA